MNWRLFGFGARYARPTVLEMKEILGVDLIGANIKHFIT